MNSVPPHYTTRHPPRPAISVPPPPQRNRGSMPVTNSMGYFRSPVAGTFSQPLNQDEYSQSATFPGAFDPYDTIDGTFSESPAVQGTPLLTTPTDNLAVSPVMKYDPFNHFLAPESGPWNSAHIASHSIPGASNKGGFSFPQTDRLGQYRGQNLDDNESFTTAPVASNADSAYHTGTFSATSHEPMNSSQDCAELVDGMRSMAPPDVRSSWSSGLEGPVTQQQAQSSSTDLISEHNEHMCKYCGDIFRLASELKKHVSKHDKPHECFFPDCRRKEGFTSNNDLNRHLASVHNYFQAGAKMFKCASSICCEKDKIWPRQDNFVQHMQRMHKNEDRDDLLRRSEQTVTTGGEPSSLQTTISRQWSKSRRGRQDGPPAVYHSDLNSVDDTHLTVPNKRRKGYAVNPSRSSSLRRRAGGSSSVYPRGNTADIKSERGHTAPTINRSHLTSTKGNQSTTSTSSGIILHHDTKDQMQKDELAQFLASDVEQNSASGSLELKLRQAVERAFTSSRFNILKSIEIEPLQSTGIGNSKSPLSSQNSIKHQQINRNQGSEGSDCQSFNHDTIGPDFKCEYCPKVVSRRCDLKRHTRRHTRPYGCTFDGCYKQFGSKNDWKRHENSQHCQEDMWRCEEISSISGPMLELNNCNLDRICARVFSSKGSFVSHLRHKHAIETKELLDERIKSKRIGFNGLGSYWCGFCEKIIELEHKGLKAWEDRFNHIGDHYSIDKYSIHNWLPSEGKKKKGEIEKTQLEAGHLDVESVQNEEFGDITVASRDNSPFAQPREVDDRFDFGSSTAIEDSNISLNSSPMPSLSQVPNAEDRFDLEVFYCCMCKDDPMGMSTTGQSWCLNCHHRFCDDCILERYSRG